MLRPGTHAGQRSPVQGADATRQDVAQLRLLFVIPFSPRTDTKHGGRVTAQLLLRLAEGHRVALVCLRSPSSPPIDPQLAERCDLVEEIALGDSGVIGFEWRHRLHVLSTPLTGVPSAVARLRDSRFAQACLDVADRWQPDVVQIEHDTIADCGRLLRENGNRAVRILICHDPGVLASEDQARAMRGRQRFAHRLDAASWRRYWSRTLPAFDAIVTFTDTDRDAIRAAVTGPRLAKIGLGIDLPDEPLSAIGHGEKNVLFVGSYGHPPNTDAALRLVRSIMPAVRRRLPGLRLLLVGAEPTRELLDAATRDETVTGTVPSVTSFLDHASLLVLPIRLGGGMRVKLLEALAAGKAVVASPLAAAGLNVTDGKELVLADTDDEFTEAIVTLIDDEAARSRLGHHARAWALRHLSWDSRVTQYERLYRSLLASRGR